MERQRKQDGGFEGTIKQRRKDKVKIREILLKLKKIKENNKKYRKK